MAIFSRWASSDNTAPVIETASGKETGRLVFGHDITSVSFESPDGRYLAVGGNDSTARVREFASGKNIGQTVLFGGGETDGTVHSVSFSPDGRYLAAGSEDGTARVIEAASGKEIRELKIGGSVHSVRFSPDGRFLAAGGDDNSAHVIEAASGKEIQQPGVWRQGGIGELQPRWPSAGGGK